MLYSNAQPLFRICKSLSLIFASKCKKQFLSQTQISGTWIPAKLQAKRNENLLKFSMTWGQENWHSLCWVMVSLCWAWLCDKWDRQIVTSAFSVFLIISCTFSLLSQLAQKVEISHDPDLECVYNSPSLNNSKEMCRLTYLHSTKQHYKKKKQTKLKQNETNKKKHEIRF